MVTLYILAEQNCLLADQCSYAGHDIIRAIAIATDGQAVIIGRSSV